MAPSQVGALPVVEFLILVDGIKARLESREKAAEGGVALGI